MCSNKQMNCANSTRAENTPSYFGLLNSKFDLSHFLNIDNQGIFDDMNRKMVFIIIYKNNEIYFISQITDVSIVQIMYDWR